MSRVPVLISMLFAMLFSLVAYSPALSVEAVDVKADTKLLDLSAVVEYHEADGDRIQVSTAPGPDGIVRRIEVRARQNSVIPGWVVFALANNTDRQIDRYLVVPHFRMAGSGLLMPDLGAERVASISTSQGFAPERIPDSEADVFRVTLDPGNVVTFVLEQSSRKLPALSLWEPQAYKDYVNSYTFYRGIVLGIAGLLALFLVILFVVKGAAMFPAAALLAWSVLAYLAIDFGFMGRLFDISTAAEPIWRAVAEVVFSTSILILLFTYLTLHRWHVRYLHASGIWLVFLIVVLGIALFDPSLGAGIARLSMVVTAIAGFGVILYLAYTGFDRAIMLIPTWILLLLWLLASGAAVAGFLTNDLVQPALSGGLVLLVLLFCFTIMQHAFSGGILAQGIVSDSERRALAIVGSGDMVWDWDVPRDRIYTSGEAERILGLKRGTLSGHARDWLDILHPQDKDRFSSMLDAVIDQRRGRVNFDFRLRAEDGHYRWFKLRVRPVVGTDGEVVRCVGTLLDITDQRTAEERMLHDAVHDNLTGLANRELLHDRLAIAMTRTQAEGAAKPAVLLVDMDNFRKINDNYGMSMGDSILLTIARRLTRLLKPQDSIARFYGDQFAIILLSEQQPERIAIFADSVRKVLKAPIVFGDKELALSVSIGIAIHDMQIHKTASDVVNDSELALHHAKRQGGDRIEPFRPSLRQQGRGRGPLDKDLVEALERNEIEVVFQPIVGLNDRQIKGFEALARWNHPQRGTVPPSDFIPAAERTGLIVPMGIYIMEHAARQLSSWQQKLEGMDNLFMSVNISSQQLLRHDLISDVKTVLSRCNLKHGSLKLELTESLVMENPEYASQVLDRIRELGAGLSLDDFGTGYSSLAYLKHFPFDTLKIDKSFVGQGDGVSPVILQSIIRLAHELELNLVAEGVENEAAAQQLVSMGCPLAQGYLFGKPVLPTEAEQMLLVQIEQTKAAVAAARAQHEAEAKAKAEEKARQEQAAREARLKREAAELERAQAHARQVASAPLPPAPAAQPSAAEAQKSAPKPQDKKIAKQASVAQTKPAQAETKPAQAKPEAKLDAKPAQKPQQSAQAKVTEPSAMAKSTAAKPARTIQPAPAPAAQTKPEPKQAEPKLDMDLVLEDAIGAAAAEAVADSVADSLAADVASAAKSAVTTETTKIAVDKPKASAEKPAKAAQASLKPEAPAKGAGNASKPQNEPKANKESNVKKAVPEATSNSAKKKEQSASAPSQDQPASKADTKPQARAAASTQKAAQAQQQAKQPERQNTPPVQASAKAQSVAQNPVPAAKGAAAAESGRTAQPEQSAPVQKAPVPDQPKVDQSKVEQPKPEQAKPTAGKAVPGKANAKEDEDLPFAMPDMSGIDQDIAAAIAQAMRGGKKG